MADHSKLRKENLARVPTTYRLEKPEDLDDWFDTLVRALQYGFEITVEVLREYSSEHAGYLAELLLSRLWRLIRGNVLKRFHIRRVTFKIVD